MKPSRARHLVLASAATALGLLAASPALAGADRIRSEGPLIAGGPSP